ncbi:hypothetical protein, partial [Leptospira noguchii]|uniref:hypothetical protein n=1 Tax=Leptospira noguchii TaxID=28182 RepID=UPI000B2F1266
PLGERFAELTRPLGERFAELTRPLGERFAELTRPRENSANASSKDRHFIESKKRDALVITSIINKNKKFSFY